MIEKNYHDSIDKTREIWKKKIKENQDFNEKRYQKAIEKTRKKIEEKIHEIIIEIEKNLEALEDQETFLISQVYLIYSINKEKLIQKISRLIGFDFIDKKEEIFQKEEIMLTEKDILLI